MSQSHPGDAGNANLVRQPRSAGPDAAPARRTMQFTVPVQIASTDGQYFDQSGSTVINVQNVPVDSFAPLLLFYDDDPEHVGRTASCFAAR